MSSTTDKPSVASLLRDRYNVVARLRPTLQGVMDVLSGYERNTAMYGQNGMSIVEQVSPEQSQGILREFAKTVADDSGANSLKNLERYLADALEEVRKARIAADQTAESLRA